MNKTAHSQHNRRIVVAPSTLSALPLLATALLMGVCFELSNTPADFMALKVAACFLALIASLPLSLYFTTRMNYVPLFALHTAYFISGYSLGPFFLGDDPRFHPTAAQCINPLLVCFVGLSSQILGYWLAYGTRFVRPAFVGIPSLSTPQITLVGWTMIVLALLPRLLPSVLQVPSLGHVFLLSSYAGTALLFAKLLVVRVHPLEKLMFGLAIGYFVLDGMASGSLAQALKVGLLLSVSAFAVQRFLVSGSVLMVTVLAMFIANPIKAEYRSHTWHDGPLANASLFEKGQLLSSLVVNHWISPQTSGDYADATNSYGTVERISQFPILVRVVVMTPHEVPYWKGATYQSLVGSFVPRILWPDKPTKNLGGEFGHRYRVLNPQDRMTSLNLPWLIEFYANFGVIGVALGHFLLGGVFRVIEVWYLTFTEHRISSLLAIGLFAPLIYPESDFSLMFGGLIMGVAFLKGLSMLAELILPRKLRMDSGSR